MSEFTLQEIVTVIATYGPVMTEKEAALVKWWSDGIRARNEAMLRQLKESAFSREPMPGDTAMRLLLPE